METEFDPANYLQIYPDVRSSGISPDIHYLLWGWKENRIPSKFFDPHYYVRKHRLSITETFPLAHYAVCGKPTGLHGNALSSRYWFAPSIPTETEWENVAPAKHSETTRAVVIIPVYNSFNEVMVSIYRALASRSGEQYSVLVINDGSTDDTLNAKLSALAAKGLFDYHLNSENIGFVKTINRAVEDLSFGLDVVLLNSDAYVWPRWFSRLMSHAERDHRIATVTPLSNNATICSYPLHNYDNFRSLELSPDILDQIAGRVNFGKSVEAPTGVGFCMLIRRHAFETLGLFDSKTFKVGYGEENDFCMRALHAGFKNVIAGDVFVYHTGSTSFSSTKELNLELGRLGLQAKHPNYEELVENHIAADPQRVLRRDLDGERFKIAAQNCTLIISHNWGGGTETFINDYCKKLARQGKNPFILRVHSGFYVSFESKENELFVPNLSNLDIRSEGSFVLSLIRSLCPELIHINSLAGLDWQSQRWLLRSLAEVDAFKTFMGHDYAPISHHYQLIRPDYAITAIPDLSDLKTWDNFHSRCVAKDVCDVTERIEEYAAFFGRGVRVEVPSKSTAKIYSKFFPGVNVVVSPHGDHLPEVELAKRKTNSHMLRIAVLGALSRHKGSGILQSIAQDARKRSLPIEYYLLGYSETDELLESSGVHVLGRYASDEDATRILLEIAPDIVLIPSIWSETFSYTLSIALKMKIPPVVFDIGAQSERVGQISWGAILPIDLAINPTELSNELLKIPIDRLWAAR